MSRPVREAADLERAAVAELARGLRPAAEGCEGLVVLGSGLGDFLDRIEVEERLPFADLPAMPAGRVPGHAKCFAVGARGSRRLLVQSGRVHRYEGYSPFEVARAVRAAASLGIRWCVFTNAAGGLDPAWSPGTLMALRDHVNLQRASALFPGEGGRGRVYSEAGLEALGRAAERAGVVLERGVYAGGLGPAYETPAEIRSVRRIGVDAVGMSTVVEAEAARVSGMLVAGVSCITNAAAGVSAEPLSHAEVLAAGAEAAPRFAGLIENAIEELGALTDGR